MIRVTDIRFSGYRSSAIMNTRGLTSLATSAGLAVPGDARERQGTILMVLGGLILGTVGIFVLQANQDPLTTVAFRCFFGFLALLSWGVLSGRLAEIRLQARDLLGAVATGVLMIISWAPQQAGEGSRDHTQLILRSPHRACFRNRPTRNGTHAGIPAALYRDRANAAC